MARFHRVRMRMRGPPAACQRKRRRGAGCTPLRSPASPRGHRALSNKAPSSAPACLRRWTDDGPAGRPSNPAGFQPSESDSRGFPARGGSSQSALSQLPRRALSGPRSSRPGADGAARQHPDSPVGSSRAVRVHAEAAAAGRRESDANKGTPRTWVAFTVCDSGVGIPKESQQQLFLPFSQVYSKTGAKPQGTGLGLSIVDLLVKRMGGSCSFASVEGALLPEGPGLACFACRQLMPGAKVPLGSESAHADSALATSRALAGRGSCFRFILPLAHPPPDEEDEAEADGDDFALPSAAAQPPPPPGWATAPSSTRVSEDTEALPGAAAAAGSGLSAATSVPWQDLFNERKLGKGPFAPHQQQQNRGGAAAADGPAMRTRSWGGAGPLPPGFTTMDSTGSNALTSQASAGRQHVIVAVCRRSLEARPHSRHTDLTLRTRQDKNILRRTKEWGAPLPGLH